MGDVIRIEGWLKRKLERDGNKMPLAEFIKKHDKWNELWMHKVKVLADERKQNMEGSG